MGIYGTYGAFNGLGKPSIKLEFEDNDELLAFQQRMQEPDGGNDDPDGGNFTPSTYTQEQLDNAVKNHTVTGWGIFPEIPDGWQLVKTSAAPKGFNVITKGEPSFEMTTEGWKFKRPLDAALIEKKKGLKVVKGDEEPVEGVKVVDEKGIAEYLIANPSDFISANSFNKSVLKNVIEKKDHNGNPTKLFVIKTPLKGEYKYILLRGFQLDVKLNKYNSNGQDRTPYIGLIYPTLTNPRMVIRDERGLVFVRPFKDYKTNNTILFCTTIVFDGNNYVSSNHPKHLADLIKKANSGYVLFPDAWEKSRVVASLNGTVHTNAPFEVVELCLPYIPYITENGAKSFVDGIKNSLGAPGDTYINSDGLGKAGDLYLVRDLRTRAKKEPGELAANKNLKFEKQKNDTIKNFNKELYAAPTLANGNKEINGKTYYPVKFGYKYGKNDRYISEMYLFIPKIYNASENKMRGSWRSFDVVIDADKLYNIERNPYSGGFQAYEDEATLRENTNNALRQAFADVQRNVDYQKEQIEKEKNSPWKSNGMIAKREKYLKEAYKELKYFIMFYANYGKYPAWIMSDNNGGDYPAKMAEDIPEGYIDRSIFAANLAAPGDLGKTANNTLYNNLEILDFRGMQPTYKQLPDYSQFFKPAANRNSLKGWGLADTKKLIADICRNHYKECAAIAQHLKADTKLQSAFNLWHWLHHNIRYEYDREGREEVRTPARTWADRHRGVDCDCLSVFAWCVLKCMGYNPAFELAAFRNKPAYSHIYINLDGIVIDRVWFVFNSRPPGVTKTELFKVGMLDNLGQLF